MFMFVGLEEGLMSSVVSLDFAGWVYPSVTEHGITGAISLIKGAVSSMLSSVTSVFPLIFSVGSAMSVLK